MQRFLLWAIILLVVLIALVLYRSQSRGHLNVTPDAERSIDKAKRR